MSVQSYLRFLGAIRDVAMQIGTARGLELIQESSGAITVSFFPHRVQHTRCKQVFYELFQNCRLSRSGTVDLYVSTRLICDGPRVFRPTPDECESLSEVEVNIPLSEYAQPFPTFCVELPWEFRKLNTQTGAIPAELVGHTEETEMVYRPDFVILHQSLSPPCLLGTIVTDSATHVAISSIIGDRQSRFIEDDLNRRLSEINNCTEDEYAMTRRCMRVAINACLLLMDRGFRKQRGSQDDQNYQKLREQIARHKRKPGNERLVQRDEAELHTIPQVFDFVQKVNVRRLVGDSAACEQCSVGDTARRVKPHWRSAHWRMQVHGPANSLRKRILIPHVLVNRSQFGGVESDTVVVQK